VTDSIHSFYPLLFFFFLDFLVLDGGNVVVATGRFIALTATCEFESLSKLLIKIKK
jgi:hypothetical protein